MKHKDRRKEIGKALVDIGKYFITVGLVGGVLMDKLTILIGSIMFILAVLSFIVGFYVIPETKEDK
ncbi:MAG: hypothetical protein HY754_04415 [Nitrospirae bacterium]|nr:hypothetical protein [Nitrospirota bacterium]